MNFFGFGREQITPQGDGNFNTFFSPFSFKIAFGREQITPQGDGNFLNIITFQINF